MAQIDLSQGRNASMTDGDWSLRAISLAAHTYRRKCNRSLKAVKHSICSRTWNLELGLFFSSLHQIRERFHKRSKNRTTEGDFFEIRTWIDPGSRWERVGKIKKNQKIKLEESKNQSSSGKTVPVFPSLHPIQKLKVMSSSYIRNATDWMLTSVHLNKLFLLRQDLNSC